MYILDSAVTRAVATTFNRQAPKLDDEPQGGQYSMASEIIKRKLAVEVELHIIQPP